MTAKTITLLWPSNRSISYIGTQNMRTLLWASTNRVTMRQYGSEKAEPSSSTAEPSENEKKLIADVESLTKEVEALKEKNNELTDKYKRSLADGENLRTRLTKQISDAKLFGIQGFCKDLLEVADTLGHATEAVPKEEINESNKHLKSLYEGLTMTKASLKQVFKRHGLEPINPLNEKFDPNVHEALFQKEDDNVEPNTVVVVSKVGYKLHERCIRPALVGVSKSSS
ncbi:grpE protein homolog, mitochondrial [Episyrphus balteatus]|uniref:grpE protein homolog, mitochondrial n=1 Tax=Episyrphus balteatus TaxID=286459 RepID=UPI00248515F6|nr:grpE protein homolog, mitochondrial [Episyrphus balteatus]